MNNQTSTQKMAQQFFRMWPRALFHMKDGRSFLTNNLKGPGVYVLYRDGSPYYIGRTDRSLHKRLSQHALKPNARHYNFWNYFSAFEIAEPDHRKQIEAILISAMPTANSSRPKIQRRRLDRKTAKLLNDVQALMLTGMRDRSGETDPEKSEDEEE